MHRQTARQLVQPDLESRAGKGLQCSLTRVDGHAAGLVEKLEGGDRHR